MTTLTFAIGFGPLALYFLAIAAANSGRRSRLLTAQQDFTALALGMIGLVMIGPMIMFLPVDALGFWKIITWPLLAVLYSLIVVFLGAMFPPRLIIYNITYNELRNILATLAAELDQEARWCGNSLAMPGLGVQLYIEKFAILRSVSLIATGIGQEIQGWNRLEKALTSALTRHETKSNRVWLMMTTVGLILGFFVIVLLYVDSEVVIIALKEFMAA